MHRALLSAFSALLLAGCGDVERVSAKVPFEFHPKRQLMALLRPWIAEHQACFRGHSKCQGRVDSGLTPPLRSPAQMRPGEADADPRPGWSGPC